MTTPTLLHGTISATIHGIDKLHTGSCVGLCQKWGKKFLAQVKKMVCGAEIIGASVYATVDLDKARMARTRMVRKHQSRPQWEESFRIYCAHSVSNVVFTIKYDNPVGATLIGRAYVPVENVARGHKYDNWVPIVDEAFNPIQGGSKIHVKLAYIDVAQEGFWSRGIASPHFSGVPYTFFNQRQGCMVTLYHDAHLLKDFDSIFFRTGVSYEPPRCWEDIFDALSNAKHLIYITGWSVYTEIKLVRDPTRPKPGGDIKLGELLKKKADEGVTVLMLVWDDRTSVKDLKKDGLMATHC